ncbi:MAG: MBL fold metallo-hydrolase [Candidatus Bathyarchaeota archaeon]|nr:MBL fold metallo-hydrolase [Candidatus Bathyarchaeota archaeon]
MSLRDKAVLGSLLALIIIAVGSQLVSNPATSVVEIGDVNVTLLTNAGIMIETEDARIYIDPIDLPEEYGDRPADAVLVTHDHGDHYQFASIRLVQKEDTINVFPESMTSEIRSHDGVAVVPGDELMVGDIKITAYYMYTFSPDGTSAASHPIESGFTSYIIDINGFTLFHAGDSKNLPEYEALKGTIDVACLPLGPGCQTMYGDEVVDVVEVLEPSYMIPIHYTEDSYRNFDVVYKRQVEPLGCTFVGLQEFSMYSFETGS